MEFVGCSCYIIPRKTLYVVHDGAIYAAQTSDAGVITATPTRGSCRASF
jgi:hypothetical protein